jgi:hypothetical protein
MDPPTRHRCIVENQTTCGRFVFLWAIIIGVVFPLTCFAETPAASPKKITTTLESVFGKVPAAVKFKRTPMVKFFEELFAEYPREKAPGYWIDQLSCDQPKKKDIAPQLDDETLYGDVEAVNDHWEAFKKRNPKTAVELTAYIERPTVKDMPATRISRIGKDKGMEEFFRSWVSRRESYCTGDRPKFFHAVGAYLLYADFLIARGGDKHKQQARAGLRRLTRVLETYLCTSGKHLPSHADTYDLSISVGMEIVWPLMDVSKDRYDEYCSIWIRSTLFRECRRSEKKDIRDKLYQTKDYLRFAKWEIANAPKPTESLGLAVHALSSAYRSHKDYLMFFFLRYASSNGKIGLGYFEGFKSNFVKLDSIKGDRYYERFLELLLNEKIALTTKQSVYVAQGDVAAGKGNKKHALALYHRAMKMNPKGSIRAYVQKQIQTRINALDK